MLVLLNTNQIIGNLSGKNKTFITKVAKTQEEKYGNVDIFDAKIEDNKVEIGFGDYWITFYFRDGKVYDTLGNGQGHKYHSSLQACAEELMRKYDNDDLIW